MNKKILVFGMLGIFAIGLVAAVTYYSVFSIAFFVAPAIVVEGDLEQTLPSTSAGETIRGFEIEIINNAPSERLLLISDNSTEDVDVSYVVNLELTKKDVDFNLDVWEIPNDADKVQIEYTVIGNEFSAEVIGDGIEGYVLVYYPDNDDRFINPSEAWPIGIWELDSLPMEWDWNAGNAEGDYNYCDTGEYLTCHGAKIWYVPSDALTLNVEESYDIDWNDASNFYFESSLIQYNSEGKIVLYPGQTLIITPVYHIDEYASGDYKITTTVA